MNRVEATTHLQWQFADALEAGLKIVICSRLDFAGRAFDSIENAVKFVGTVAENNDVWVCMGVRKSDPNPGTRGSPEDMDGLCSVWADLDVAGKAHPKPNQIPTIEKAIQFAETCFVGTPPSFIVKSGHGVQAHWLLSEPWIFDGPEENAKAQAFSMRWHTTIREALKADGGFQYDRLADLCRILRLSGTFNHKLGEKRPVTIYKPALSDKPRRYHLEDLEGLLIAEDFLPADTGGSKVVETVGFVTLGPDRQPPRDKLVALLANSENARATWEHKRPDLADQSASGYDMSLAIFAAMANWTDQEIADLLIAHRKKHGADLKTLQRTGAMRLEYYQRTISIARSRVSRDRTVGRIASQTTNVPLTTKAGVTDKEKKNILKMASDVLCHPIARFVQHGLGEDALFFLELEDGMTVALGGATNLENQKSFRSRLYPITRRLFDPIKPAVWNRFMSDMGLICEIEENPESSRAAQFAAMLCDYLTVRLRYKDAEADRAVVQGEPFTSDGKIYINRQNLEEWLATKSNRDYLKGDIWSGFRALRFDSLKISARSNTRVFNRAYWATNYSRFQEATGFGSPPDTGQTIKFENNAGRSAEGKTGSGLPNTQTVRDGLGDGKGSQPKQGKTT